MFINRSWQKLPVIIEELVLDSARSWCRFNHIAEKEKEDTESQKINELSGFRMIQAVIKCFEKDQQSRELRFRTCQAVYLYDVNTAIAKWGTKSW